MSWRDQALCRDIHRDLLYPPFGDERSVPEHRYTDMAKMVCEHCEVRDRCHLDGRDEQWGVWGGTTPMERASNQPFTPPPYKLVPYYLDKVPKNRPEPLDIVAAWVEIRKYSDKRT